MMETIGDAKDVTRLSPLTIAIPSKQGVVLTSHDSSSGTTHSRSKMPLCPAYRFCRELRGPYRSPMLDSDYDQQQITTLHDLLQAIKEAALKLIQLITINIEKRKRDADPRMRYLDSRRYEKSNQPRRLESGPIATTSSSVCALCGVALHLKDSSEKSRQFVINRERSDDYHHDLLSKLDNMFLKMAYKIPLSAEISDNFPISGSALNYILAKEIDNIDVRGQEKISLKTESTDMSESGLQSKLLFIRGDSSDKITHQIYPNVFQRRYDSTNQMPKYASKSEYKINESSHHCIDINISSTISSTQDASTLTQEMLCPCACGLLVKDATESKISINPIPALNDKLIKSKLEELGLHLVTREMTQKVHDNIVKVKKTKMQKSEKERNVKRWIEEIVQLQLQVQIEELHKNIQFFKQENEYIRCLAEKCRCLSEDVRSLQQLLPISEIHSAGFSTTIKHLQAKHHNEHGIITTLTGMFRGSINIQQIAAKLLAPFLEHWNPRDKYFRCDVNDYNRAIKFLM